MDGLREFLDDLQQRRIATGNFLGLLHLLIGRRIERGDGALISQGCTWRMLAELLISTSVVASLSKVGLSSLRSP